jgi:GWxTD domain-containing protein
VPGRYEGFVEIKDVQAKTYGNGRVSVNVPDFSENLPKISTPLFYDLGKLPENIDPKIPAPEEPFREASLKYPAGKPIFLLLEVYADSTNQPDDWEITAEVVKALMLFPRIEVSLEDGVLYQRKLLEIPTKTMGLGTYEIEVDLRDKRNSILARANTFKFRIIKSAEWIAENSENEIRYLKYLVSDNELKRLLNLSQEEQVKALNEFWKKIDPVPATAINELRVQYFERIEYANKNFTTEQREGWETNMGEVYIMLGPPSEIYGSRLNQIWVYERENLVLTFFGHNLRNRDVFDEYIRDRRWWRDSGDSY